MPEFADTEVDPTAQRFAELHALRLTLETHLASAQETLDQYRDPQSGGWYHLHPNVAPKSPGDFSRASTATCLALDRVAGLRMVEADKAQTLADAILTGPWDSAGLPEDNPFTVAFLLEALADLKNLGASIDDSQETKIRDKSARLVGAFDEHSELADEGGIAVNPYPATAFLTFKAVHALMRWASIDSSIGEMFSSNLRQKISRWSWAALHAESVLVSSNSHDADVFELAYAILTVTTITEFSEMTPPQRGIIGYGLDQFFAAQGPDGTWPRSRPLFHYPTYGDAYCYDYELLVSVLGNKRLRPLLREHLTELRIAALALERLRFPVGIGFGWSSGHLRQIRSAESWSTASVFHFCFELTTLVALEIRRLVFDDVGQSLPEVLPVASGKIDRSKFLDSRIEREGENQLSLTEVIDQGFLAPIYGSLEQASRGSGFPKDVPRAAIFYGPPGTSKTQLAQLIADALGWPLLKIDPSHLTRRGLDRLHAEANRLFGMLEAADETVVLLDEFDELVREREGPNEVLSRFLTTAMLPKLTALHDRRQIVVLLATNHVESFDSAIRRPGRFDMIVPVMQPTLEAKLAVPAWSSVADKVSELGIRFDLIKFGEIRTHLDALTYSEYSAIVQRLGSALSIREFERIASEAYHGCTLKQQLPVIEHEGPDEPESWERRVMSQQSKIRLPESLPGMTHLTES